MNRAEPRREIRDIELFHGLVLKASVEDAESILAFIERTNAELIFQRHSANYLRIVEERNTESDRHD